MSLSSQAPIVIAHRGASAYLPEHSMEAKVLAHAQGADYIEQDVVMTRDGALVVLHDLSLDRVTDVADCFPGRAREDGHFYVADFTLAEIRSLRMSSPFFLDEGGIRQPLFPGRFPVGYGNFRVHTLSEEIQVIQGLNATTGRKAGIYPELKAPWFHHQQGLDISMAMLEILKAHGYVGRDDPIYLQSFDHRELRRVRDELMPALGMDLPLVQLIADNAWGETREQDASGEWRPYDYDWMHSREGLGILARKVQGIGPAYSMLITEAESGAVRFNSLVEEAHAAGLQVHPYTFRREAGYLPAYVESFEALLKLFLVEAGVDGIFTDFPDEAVAFIEALAAPE